MSDKFELIEAKDLPMTEEEDVTVLCVGADGEIKRKPAKGLGGGEYDAEIHVTSTDGGNPTAELVVGSFETIRSLVLAGKKPNIAVRVTDIADVTWHETSSALTVQACENDAEPVWVLIYFMDDTFWLSINSDGSVDTD